MTDHQGRWQSHHKGSDEDRWDRRQAIENMDTDAWRDNETRRNSEPTTWVVSIWETIVNTA